MLGLIEHITKLKKLRALQISDVLSMNDVVLSAITRDCSQIVVLEVNNNSNITDGCAAVIKELKLSKLNLARTAVSISERNVSHFRLRVSFLEKHDQKKNRFRSYNNNEAYILFKQQFNC